MDDRNSEAEQIKTWMRNVMSGRDWSAEHWARVADTSPTNITRFLKDGGHVPSTRTIAKLSRAAGSMPQIGRSVRSLVAAERTVPLYSSKDIVAIFLNGEPAAASLKKKVITTMQQTSEAAFAYAVQCRSMELQGIVVGDTVIFEPAMVQAPKDGKTVLYAGEGEGSFRLGVLQEPWIFHHTAENLPAVLAKNVTIVGVAVEVRRAL